MKPTMNDGKMPEEGLPQGPTYIVTSESSEKTKNGKQKKYIIISVAGLLVVGMIIAAVLISMHMFTQAQKDIVKFSFQFKGSKDNDVNQEVTADPNDNVVMFHVTQEGQDAYIVNDFNKGMQFIKLTVDSQTSCFVTPLNMSEALSPSQIKDADSMKNADGKKKAEAPFQIASEPVVDRSFLTKKAADMCKGVTLYWVHKKCLDSKQELPSNNSTNIGNSDTGRTKRSIYIMSPVYGMYGLGGCCSAYWACYLRMTEYISAYGVHTCYTYYQTGSCCGAIAYPYCQNLYYSRWATPGLVC